MPGVPSASEAVAISDSCRAAAAACSGTAVQRAPCDARSRHRYIGLHRALKNPNHPRQAMRRSSKRTFWQSAFYDIRKDLTPGQLEAIGAVMLAWNDIEGQLDHTLSLAIDLPFSIALEVTSRINGLDGKFEIVRKAAQYHLRLPDAVYQSIAQTLNILENPYKQYRDGVAHAWILHPREIIAPSAKQRGKLFEVLVSVDALNLLYDHLAVLQSEMGAVRNIIFTRSQLMQQRLRPVRVRELQLTEPEVLAHTELLRGHQRRRLALQKLPEFPPEYEDPPMTEEPQSPGA
jgi:hypothetical protein